jgi:polysaccharide biosynthesis protein VpsQ
MFRGDSMADPAFARELRGRGGQAALWTSGGRLHLRPVRNFFRLGFLAWLSLVVLISIGAYTGLLPTSLPDFPGADKVGHAFIIGPLGFFLDGALDHRRLHPRLAFPRLGPALVLTAAGIEEYLQRLSPRRTSDFWDFAADVVGVCFFAWLSRRVDTRREAAVRA